MARGLSRYRQKRDFSKTPEPAPGAAPAVPGPARFVVQKHAARRLHYDLRLEHEGVLKSFAVTRGPSLDPKDKRLAVETEDHPLAYEDFEGVIPQGSYGGGTMIVWDRGTWDMVDGKDADEGFKAGALTFTLHGERLSGRWHLQRLRAEKNRPPQWLLIKVKDDDARPGEPAVTETFATSILTGLTIEEVAKGVAPRNDAADVMPGFVPPMLCEARRSPPARDDWLAELKYDGYRAIVRIAGDDVRLFTRSGADWSERFPAIIEAAGALPTRSAMLDGEVVVFDEAGRTDFSRLQNAAKTGGADAVYIAFDALFLDGEDLRGAPIEARKAALEALTKDAGGAIRYGDHVTGQQGALFEKAAALGLEGIIAKRAGSRYRSGRGAAWVKVRAVRRAPFVIGGFTESAGRLGALLLGAHEDGRLVAMGRVGTGFSQADAARLLDLLRPLQVARTPFAGRGAAGREGRDVRFVKPRLVCKVEYLALTAERQLRHAVYQGMVDMDPHDVHMPSEGPAEMEAAPEAAPAPRKRGPVRKGTQDEATFEGVTLSNPQKVLFPEQNITKAALAEHYQAHMRRMLPQIAERPLTLVRCPQGRGKACFFQRHPEGMPPEMAVDIGEDDGLAITVRTPADVMALVQRGVLEIHLRGARVDAPDRPDRLIFDLDPGEGVGFEEIREAALLVRARLKALDLASFVKTTGGKGLHVMVPIERRTPFALAKAFTRRVAADLAQEAPSRYVVVLSKAKRKGRIFIDYLRNDAKASAVAPYSTRARPGAPFSVPISWAALERATELPVYRVGEVIGGHDPWAGVASVRQRLGKAHLKGLDEG